MKNKILIVALFICFGLAGCTMNSNLTTPTQDSVIEQKNDTINTPDTIPDSCTIYFDGCNTCQRTPDGTSACTLKYCETYGQAYCMDDESSDDRDHDTDDTDDDHITSDLDDEYIGLTREQAQKLAQANNIMIRAVSIDGEPQIITADYRKGRINATIKNEVVIDIDIE